MVMQVFVQFRCYSMFHRLANGVRSKACAHAFSEARDAAPVFLRAVAKLADSGSKNDMCRRAFPDRLLLPLPTVRMSIVAVRSAETQRAQQHQSDDGAGCPHAVYTRNPVAENAVRAKAHTPRVSP